MLKTKPTLTVIMLSGSWPGDYIFSHLVNY